MGAQATPILTHPSNLRATARRPDAEPRHDRSPGGEWPNAGALDKDGNHWDNIYQESHRNWNLPDDPLHLSLARACPSLEREPWRPSGPAGQLTPRRLALAPSTS